MTSEMTTTQPAPVQMVQAWLRWLGAGSVVGITAGLASALFLYLLRLVTQLRGGHPQLVYLLPIAGLLWGLFYERYGQVMAGGNNLVIDNLHSDAQRLPWRMAPFVLLGTLTTHLFGGSAGREGTAVQMGAGLADGIHRVLGRFGPTRSHVVMAGMAGGFGSIFGTPVAGTLFALEMGTIGRLDYAALVPCLTAAVFGDWATRHTLTQHEFYPTPAALLMTPGMVLKWIVVGVVVACVAWAFIEMTHGLARYQGLRLPVKMFFGGIFVVCLWRLLGTDIYMGLGDETLMRAFWDPDLAPYTFAVKMLATAVTLGSGFLGGEVTPLFFIGACLGNTLAPWLNLPLDLCVGVCMAALFGAAANAPIALCFMAVELMGAALLPHVVVVVSVAYILLGARSIYPAQRLGRHKYSTTLLQSLVALRDLHKRP